MVGRSVEVMVTVNGKSFAFLVRPEGGSRWAIRMISRAMPRSAAAPSRQSFGRALSRPPRHDGGD